VNYGPLLENAVLFRTSHFSTQICLSTHKSASHFPSGILQESKYFTAQITTFNNLAQINFISRTLASNLTSFTENKMSSQQATGLSTDSGPEKRTNTGSEKTMDANPFPAVAPVGQQATNRNGDNLLDNRLICAFVLFTIVGNAYEVMRHSQWGLAAHLLCTVTVLFRFFV
jgi:hypothetical protein